MQVVKNYKLRGTLSPLAASRERVVRGVIGLSLTHTPYGGEW